MKKKPIVKLINFTPQPMELMLYVFKNMTGIVPDDFGAFVEDLDLTPELLDDFANYLAYESLAGGIMEFVSTSWYLGNVSRAFQQQLTRHRHAGYCIQSMRIQSKKNFANKGDFLIPDDIGSEEMYEEFMLNIENDYNELLDAGESNQVARGILPLNIFSSITMVINLRSLRDLICTRLCDMVQGEFKEVAQMMIKEICIKIEPELEALFEPPCERDGYCFHSEGCGKANPLVYNTMTEGLKGFISR